MIKVKSVSDEELTRRYGNHLRHEVDECFSTQTGHYYKQRSEDVLHIGEGGMINTNHNSTFDRKEVIKISNEEFDFQVKKVIFDLDLYKYCK
jgi:hypothetical protein